MFVEKGSYKGFDLRVSTQTNEVAIYVDTPDGSFRQTLEQPIHSVEEAEKLIDSGSFRKVG